MVFPSMWTLVRRRSAPRRYFPSCRFNSEIPASFSVDVSSFPSTHPSFPDFLVVCPINTTGTRFVCLINTLTTTRTERQSKGQEKSNRARARSEHAAVPVSHRPPLGGLLRRAQNGPVNPNRREMARASCAQSRATNSA